MTRLILIASLFVLACTSSNSVKITDSTTNDGNMTSTPIAINGCYGYALNKDTATMKLVETRDGVTGVLIYNWSQKDDNRGTLKGVRKDSLLIANYTFQSEGLTSLREVVFKIKDNALTEGFGEVYMSGDTTKFKSLKQLQFQNDRAFVKVDCKD